VVPENAAAVLTTTDYGLSFVSAIQWKNVVGMQFHPEKSGTIGLSLLKTFGEGK
jgi:imidazoleglycerol phosphate synthase glutamine amidotransferase subunit HisH